MPITDQQIKEKNNEILQKQLAAQLAQNTANLARAEENKARGELQIMLIQKQIEASQPQQ